MAVTADMTLTAALIVFLHRSRTGLKRYALPLDRLIPILIRYNTGRTDTMIDIMILYSVNTGTSLLS